MQNGHCHDNNVDESERCSIYYRDAMLCVFRLKFFAIISFCCELHTLIQVLNYQQLELFIELVSEWITVKAVHGH